MPQSLPRLLDSRQALEIIPSVLYFASIGEGLQPMGESVAVGLSSCVKSARMQQVLKEDGIKCGAASAALNTSSVRNKSSEFHRNQSHCSSHRDGVPQKAPRHAHSSVAQTRLVNQNLKSIPDDKMEWGGVLENDVFYFSLSRSPAFQHRSFFADFGPLPLSSVALFSRWLETLLESFSFSCCRALDRDDEVVSGSRQTSKRSSFGSGSLQQGDQTRKGEMFMKSQGSSYSRRHIPVVLCSGLGNHERANTACLLACFCVATLRWSAWDTWRVFQKAYPPIMSFRDASYGVSAFPLTLLDVISGLEKAIAFGWYDVRTFDIAEFDWLRSYDCSWVVPRVLMAFSSPTSGKLERSVEVYAKLFQQLRVTHVVRLSEPQYKRKTFLANGVRHVHLEFPNDSTPNDDIVNRFMRAVKPVLPPSLPCQKPKDKCGHSWRKGMKNDGVSCSPSCGDGGNGSVAVHCCTGLGRTGTLICMYLIQEYGFTARECIGWTRLCRPGSVVGVQQVFLEKFERRLSRPRRRSDTLRAEYHASVVGSGVIAGVSNYKYQIQSFQKTLSPSSPSLIPPSPEDAMEAGNADERPERRLVMPLYGASHGLTHAGMQTSKHPSSYLLALEHLKSSQNTFTPKSRPSTHHLRARQAEGKCVLVQRRGPCLPPQGVETPRPQHQQQQAATTSEENMMKVEDVVVQSANDSKSGTVELPPDNAVRDDENDLLDFPQRALETLPTSWRTSETTANITLLRLQALVRQLRGRHRMPGNEPRAGKRDIMESFCSVTQLGTRHGHLRSPTIGSGGEDLTAINASACGCDASHRRLSVDCHLSLFRGSKCGVLPKNESLSSSLERDVAEDPGWGSPAVRLLE